MPAPKYINYDEDGMGTYSDTPGQKSRVVGGTQSKAGAGRGGQGGPTAKQADENRAMMSAAERAARDDMQEQKDMRDAEKAYNKSLTSMKKGGMTASARADGIATKGKTRGKIVMCGGGMYKK